MNVKYNQDFRNIVCIKWGDYYPSCFVNNMYAMVRRNLTGPFRFICLTDDTKGIIPQVEIIPIDDTYKGWWAKIHYYKNPFHDVEGVVLHIDLDMVIVRNIDCLFEYYPGEFVMKEDPDKNCYNASLIRFCVNQYSFLHDELDLTTFGHSNTNLEPDYKKYPIWSDQQWTTQQMKKYNENVIIWEKSWLPLFRRLKKNSEKTKKSIEELLEIENNARILCFYGRNYDQRKFLPDVEKWWHHDDL